MYIYYKPNTTQIMAISDTRDALPKYPSVKTKEKLGPVETFKLEKVNGKIKAIKIKKTLFLKKI